MRTIAAYLTLTLLLALAPAATAGNETADMDFLVLPVGDPGGGFEPHVLAGPSYDDSGEWYYYDSPTGLGGTQGGNLWISKDYGETWVWYDKDTIVGSSGDSFTAISKDGYIYYTDLYLSSASVDTSLDGGETWYLNPVASQYVLDDRQWLDIGPSRDGIGDETLYFSFNQIPSGLVMVKAPITTGNEVPYVWQECAVFDTEARFRDNHAVDEASGMLYIANAQNNGLHMLVSDDGCNSFTKYQVNDFAHREQQNIFAIIDTDMAGNVYIGWSSRDHIWLAVSEDQGQTWRQFQVTNTTRVRALLWLAAGDAGQVAIGYYETANHSEGTPDEQSGWWNYDVAITHNALAGSPDFVLATIEAEVHKNGIQTTGTGGGSDRDLGDFTTVDIDDRGRILASYGKDGDDGNNARNALPMFARQNDGPFLREGFGPVIDHQLDRSDLKVYLHAAAVDREGLDITTLTVDWGDGVTTNLSDDSASHTYLRDGEYEITLRATNELGMRNATVVTVRVAEADDEGLLPPPGLPVVLAALGLAALRRRRD